MTEMGHYWAGHIEVYSVEGWVERRVAVAVGYRPTGLEVVAIVADLGVVEAPIVGPEGLEGQYMVGIGGAVGFVDIDVVVDYTDWVGTVRDTVQQAGRSSGAHCYQKIP